MKHIMPSKDFSKTSPKYLRISIPVSFAVVTLAKGSRMTLFSRSERQQKKLESGKIAVYSVESYSAFWGPMFLTFKWDK